MKWPKSNEVFFKDGNGKAINSTISIWTRARTPLFSSNTNSLLLSSRATRDKKFSWTSPLSDRKVPIVWTADWFLWSVRSLCISRCILHTEWIVWYSSLGIVIHDIIIRYRESIWPGTSLRQTELNAGNLEPDLLARKGGWLAKRPSCRTQWSEWDKAYQCFLLYICLDFIQGACTESLDGQVQGATTRPPHPWSLWQVNHFPQALLVVLWLWVTALIWLA